MYVWVHCNMEKRYQERLNLRERERTERRAGVGRGWRVTCLSGLTVLRVFCLCGGLVHKIYLIMKV